MSIHWQRGAYVPYWSADPYVGLAAVSAIMTLNRFQDILRNLSVRDPTESRPAKGEEGYDPLWYARVMIERVQKRLLVVFRPSGVVTVDESMQFQKSKCEIRQYCKDKPSRSRWGVKHWALACGSTGILVYFIPYLGGGVWPIGCPTQEELDFFAAASGIGSCWVAALVHACKGVLQPASTIVADNLFSSVKLVEWLGMKGYTFVGTVRKSRTCYPCDINITEQEAKAQGLRRGNTLHRMLALPGGKVVTALTYIDSKVVRFYSSRHASPAQDPSNKKKRWNKATGAYEDVHIPKIKHFYDQHKSGVDRFDQVASYYHMELVTRRPWQRTFFWLLNLVVVTAYKYQQLVRGNGGFL
eukprot:jgi/Mesvir1/2133/Mv25641-RA.1